MFWKAAPRMANRYKKRCLERNSTGKGDTNRIRVMNARVEMSRWRKICRWGDDRLIFDDSPGEIIKS